MANTEFTKRVQVKLSTEQYDKLKFWANKLGITMSQLGGMSVAGGLDAIVRAVSPVDSLTPTQWALIVEAMEQRKEEGLIAK